MEGLTSFIEENVKADKPVGAVVNTNRGKSRLEGFHREISPSTLLK